MLAVVPDRGLAAPPPARPRHRLSHSACTAGRPAEPAGPAPAAPPSPPAPCPALARGLLAAGPALRDAPRHADRDRRRRPLRRLRATSQHLTNWDGIYWALTTMTTLGSNIYPTTTGGEIVSTADPDRRHRLRRPAHRRLRPALPQPRNPRGRARAEAEQLSAEALALRELKKRPANSCSRSRSRSSAWSTTTRRRRCARLTARTRKLSLRRRWRRSSPRAPPSRRGRAGW